MHACAERSTLVDREADDLASSVVEANEPQLLLGALNVFDQLYAEVLEYVHCAPRGVLDRDLGCSFGVECRELRIRAELQDLCHHGKQASGSILGELPRVSEERSSGEAAAVRVLAGSYAFYSRSS